MRIEYYVMDPTGNVTILVTTKVEVLRQPEIALELMKLEPEAEQVGFVSFPAAENPAQDDEKNPSVHLRMAGGEFCGNATMSAAALYCLLADKKPTAQGQPFQILVSVSGVEEPLNVELAADPSGNMYGTVDMPKVLGVESLDGAFTAKVVTIPGITHLVTEQKLDDAVACDIVRQYAYENELEAVGLMQIDSVRNILKPLVFVETADTLYWEHSCASGTSAAGAALAASCGHQVQKTFEEPGGSLKVTAWPDGIVKLTGQVKLLKHSYTERNTKC